MPLKRYVIYMEWDSYEGSLFKETSTTWIHAYDKQDAENRARSTHGNNKGFIIKDIYED